jgi:hypothetical protein
MQWTSTVLAIAGVAVSALFGVLAAVPSNPSGFVIGAAIVLGVLAALWLVVMSSPRVYEWRKRRQLRERLGLERLDKLQQENSPSEIANGQYGFDVIYSVHGLKELDPDPNNWARLKRARGTATYVGRYPLEIHRRDGKTYLVGFVSDDDKRLLDGTSGGEVKLWMRPLWRAKTAVEVALERVEREGSRGDGTWRNPWRLELLLTPQTRTKTRHEVEPAS